MSYLFYGWWNWHFVPLMILSTTVDYMAGNRIIATQSRHMRRLWLASSLSFNLAILGFFKYYGFFAESWNAFTARLLVDATVPVLNVILPIGISFYTFNSMSYTIDIYRGRVRPAKSFLHFSAFVAMFPHLIAGPIVRYSDIEDQFQRLKESLKWDWVGRAIVFFVLGIAKKVLIADRLAAFVNGHFAGSAPLDFCTAWLAVVGYTMQLYFDFSGYSDMAVGLALLLGIRFPQNFDSPYIALNVSDFWRRWHISLSTWLRDYLFIPLGGSRHGLAFTARNLAITMFLGGLWHGAHWTFALWGLYHGILLAAYQLLKRTGVVPRSAFISRGITFIFVAFGWILFRADTLQRARQVFWSAMGGSGFAVPRPPASFVLVLGLACALAFCGPNTWQISFKPTRLGALGFAAIFVMCVLLLKEASPFLYFQF
jgi:alginate O-acetyltransferase complex protein AlgI